MIRPVIHPMNHLMRTRTFSPEDGSKEILIRLGADLVHTEYISAESRKELNDNITAPRRRR